MVSTDDLSSVPVVGVVADAQTYRNLVYLLLAIPLGFVYSTYFTFGLLFGLLFAVVVVGLGVLLLTVLGCRLLGGVERWLATTLLSVDLEPYDDVPSHDGGVVAAVRPYLHAPSTWRAVGFLSVKFWVTLFALVLLLGFSSALGLTSAVARYPFTASFGEVNGEPVTWTIESLPEAGLATVLGLAGVLVLLHLSNAIAYVAGRTAAAMVGEEVDEDAVADSGDDAVEGDEGKESASQPTATEPDVDEDPFVVPDLAGEGDGSSGASAPDDADPDPKKGS